MNQSTAFYTRKSYETPNLGIKLRRLGEDARMVSPNIYLRDDGIDGVDVLN